jgi:hypothetical protein
MTAQGIATTIPPVPAQGKIPVSRGPDGKLRPVAPRPSAPGVAAPKLPPPPKNLRSGRLPTQRVTVGKVDGGQFTKVTPAAKRKAAPPPPNKMDMTEMGVRVLPWRNAHTVAFMIRWWLGGKVKVSKSVFIGEFATEQEARESTPFRELEALCQRKSKSPAQRA